MGRKLEFKVIRGRRHSTTLPVEKTSTEEGGEYPIETRERDKGMGATQLDNTVRPDCRSHEAAKDKTESALPGVRHTSMSG